MGIEPIAFCLFQGYMVNGYLIGAQTPVGVFPSLETQRKWGNKRQKKKKLALILFDQLYHVHK